MTTGCIKNIDDKKMTVHFSEGHFEIIVQNQKLLLFNSFDYQTQDFIYVLFYCKAMNLNLKIFR
jgi:hypothetical protein